MEFTAGLPGKSIEKTLDIRLVVWGAVARLCSFRDSTRGHFCHCQLAVQPDRTVVRTCSPSSICAAKSSPTLLSVLAATRVEKKNAAATRANPILRVAGSVGAIAAQPTGSKRK